MVRLRQCGCGEGWCGFICRMCCRSCGRGKDVETKCCAKGLKSLWTAGIAGVSVWVDGEPSRFPLCLRQSTQYSCVEQHFKQVEQNRVDQEHERPTDR